MCSLCLISWVICLTRPVVSIVPCYTNCWQNTCECLNCGWKVNGYLNSVEQSLSTPNDL